MDLNPLFPAIYTAMLWLAPLSLVAMFVASSPFKGWLGRRLVDLAARLQLDEDEYVLLTDVTLPVNGSTLHIDHLIVSRFGLFIVEIHSMQGRIYGGRRRHSWVRMLYPTRETFENPRQIGAEHAQLLAGALDLPEEKLHPLVLFVGDNVFKTEMPENVVHGSSYIRYIETKQEELLDLQEMVYILEWIESARVRPTLQLKLQAWLDRAAHLLEAFTARPDVKSCPRCGSPMLLHTSKKFDEMGKQFWGCSTFPACRGVLDVTHVPELGTGKPARYSGSLPSGA